jgi:RNA polymerase sporulation-specific sigma factor
MTGTQIRELACRAADGDELAFARLRRALDPTLRLLVSRYWAPGMSRDDVVQEGLLGLWAAVQGYNGALPFVPFAKLCMERKIQTLVLHARRRKFQVLNESVSLTAPVPGQDENATLAHVLPGPVRNDPAHEVVDRAAVDHVCAVLGRVRLTELERRVLGAHMLNERTGFYERLAAELGVNTKTVDNALVRARRKVALALAEAA